MEPAQVRAQGTVDHSKTRFALEGRHQKVACESCHPASGATRKWKGVPLDCRGCHGDRRNHRGALGSQCQLCHDTSNWKAIRHTAEQHSFALEGKHKLECVSCHQGGKHLTKKVPGCDSCHQMDHRAQEKPCTACHNLDLWESVAFKHKVDPRSLGGKHRSATCVDCHSGFRFTGKTMQCQSCHRAQQPHEDIGSCKGCHSPSAWDKVTLPKSSLAPSPFRVTALFDHVEHGRITSSYGMGANCWSCHQTNRTRQPPGMFWCESCHNGESAFAALGPNCGRCHAAPAGAERGPVEPAKLFDHSQHDEQSGKIKCSACHAVSIQKTEMMAGGPQHELCVQCHAADFRSAKPALCLTCHERSDPFQPNPARVATQGPKEWRTGTIPHEPHITAAMPCQSCHPVQARIPHKLAAVPSHELCGECHKPGAPNNLDLARCQGCHVPASEPVSVSIPRPWSTRAMFRHDRKHGKATCDSCHRPDQQATLVPPTMQGCGSCHNGEQAFKVTGFGCIRCHGEAMATTEE